MATQTPLSDNVFNEFPMLERRHYQDHPSMKNGIETGLTLVGEEVSQFDRIKREGKMGKSNVVLGTTVATNAPLATQDPQFISTYQAQCRGIAPKDDVGTISKPRGKKMVTPGFATTTRSGFGVGPFGPGDSLRAATSVEHPAVDVGSLTTATGHIPGYSGHVPRTGEHQAPTRSIMTDKTLLTQNFRGHMTGYTGRKPPPM